MDVPELVDTALSRILNHEGGYTDNPKDRGNWTSGVTGIGELKGTKYGIAAASYPKLDIKNLTWEQAKEIYYRDFWVKYKIDNFDFCLAFQLLDACINHGPVNAIKMLQRAVGATPDGIIGNQTINKVQTMGYNKTCINFVSERIKFYTSLSSNNWNNFGLGWMRRMSNNLRFLATDIRR